MRLDKLFRHDGEPCFLDIRRSAWLNMLFVTIMTMLLMGTLFWMLNSIFDDLDRRVHALETQGMGKEPSDG
jgi:membrane protein required for beta-lactamase induction